MSEKPEEAKGEAIETLDVLTEITQHRVLEGREIVFHTAKLRLPPGTVVERGTSSVTIPLSEPEP